MQSDRPQKKKSQHHSHQRVYKKNIRIVKKRNLSLDYGQKGGAKKGTGSAGQGQTHVGGPRKPRDEFFGGNFNRTSQGENFPQSYPEKSGFVENVMRQNGFEMAN